MFILHKHLLSVSHVLY